MVLHQDRPLNGAVRPTRFPFVFSLGDAPIGWSSINSVSLLLLGARFGAGFLVRVSNRGATPNVPPAGDQQPRPLGGSKERRRFTDLREFGEDEGKKRTAPVQTARTCRPRNLLRLVLSR